MPKMTRRRMLVSSAAASLAAGLAATPASARAAEPIDWTVPDDRFSEWFFFAGDRLLLSPVAEPMRENGLWAEPVGDGYRLTFVAVGVDWNRSPAAHAFRKDGVGEATGRYFDRLAPDCPRGHRIVGHAPRYWIKERVL